MGSPILTGTLGVALTVPQLICISVPPDEFFAIESLSVI